MNYLQKANSVLGIAILLWEIPIAPSAEEIVQTRAEDFYNRGVSKTHREDYRGAIADLQRAATLFTQQRNPANAYKSKALAIYLEWGQKRLQSPASSEPLPSWYKSGSCIGGDICQYGITSIDPEAEKTPFGGILILEKKLRMQQRPDGSGEPVEAVLDVRVVPKIRPEEWLQQVNCQIGGKADDRIVAIVQIQGFEDADLYTKVRQAWRVNFSTEKIDAIPTANIACVNPCPGGC
ncbi:tetratricopeptide repeat protein [Aerosakkonema funiforme]|uniref:Tetratricopeptide repeat protein n=1 Tax=Aerosakkonema funiforme FACHB-1375 TaxID=2949571 RepID=A0A926VK89_9CYAN|nr:hypothetical protein [Aerosakkonema funiforme]MBD2183974.1 hypothetical protein [Aerosakkonema funiforme FACHB-1375]